MKGIEGGYVGMRVTGNVQCGGSGVCRYGPSCATAPCVGEEGVATAGDWRAGINAGGQDVGERVDLSLGTLLLANPVATLASMAALATPREGSEGSELET